MTSSMDPIVEALVMFDLFPCEENARVLMEAVAAYVAGELVRKAIEEALA